MYSAMPDIKVPKVQLQCAHPSGTFCPVRSKTLKPGMNTRRNERHIPLLMGNRMVLPRTHTK